MYKMTILVTRGWGSSPKIWARAVPNHRPVPERALTDVGWGDQILEADTEPLTTYLRVPAHSDLADGVVRADCPTESARGQKLIWDTAMGILGENMRRPYDSLDDALETLYAAWDDAGWEVVVVDRRSEGGGYN